MAGETSDEMGFGSFAISDEPTRQESTTAPVAKTRSVKNRSVTKPTEEKPLLKPVVDSADVAARALEIAKGIGPAKAETPKAAIDQPGFKTDLTNMGIGAAGLAALLGTAYAVKKVFSNGTSTTPTSTTPTAPTAPTTPVNPQTLLPQQPVDLNAKIEAAKQANAARATSVAPPELVGPAPELVGPSIPPEAPAAPIAPKNMVGPPPELTGPVKPPSAPKDQLTYQTDTPETWQKLTKEGITFLRGYGPGDNSLFNTYGAEGRRTVIDRFNNGKPVGSDANYKELLTKIKQGVPSGEVPELMAKLPSAEEAGNYGKLGKAMKVAGLAGLGIAAANLAHAKTPSAARNAAGESLLGMVPGVGAGAALYHTTLQSGTFPGYEQQTQIREELLSRPDVRSNLEKAKKTMSPSEFNNYADTYLSSKIDTEQQRLQKNLAKYGTKSPVNTGMGVPPP